jgi:radical S-adenosyl methionine domain-containing protein 2
MQTNHRALPVAVNYHLNKNCNFRCKGCYAVFNDSPNVRGVMLPRDKMFALVDAVAAAPLPIGSSDRKLTFAGGEPTLCPWLPDLIAHAKSQGLVTMVVTNGSRCDSRYLDRLTDSLDWLTLSIDSLDPATNQAIGRNDSKGTTIPAMVYAEILSDATARGMRTKINTVVSSLNCHEEMNGFISSSGITRWKILQIMAVSGQNDQHIDNLSVTRAGFDAFVQRHQSVSLAGIRLVPEPVDSIRGSYAMIDPTGRFFDSALGGHRYSQPILDVGVSAAFAQVSFDHDRFISRGGSYDFAPTPASLDRTGHNQLVTVS